MKHVKAVNQYIADLALWNVKLHNLHFNVEGPNFKATHEYLESIYDEVFEYYDAVAELLRMHDEYPAASMKDYMELATMKEIKSEAISIKDAYKVLLGDLELMRDQALKLRELANEDDLFDLANMMEDHLAFYAKAIWFVKMNLK